MELSILVAICAIIVTAMALVIDALQTRSIRKINAKVEAFQPQDIGASLGDWLLEKENDTPEAKTNLETISSLVGHQIAGSFKMGLQGIASGESRVLRSVQTKMMEALQDPEIERLLGFCDKAGIDRGYADLVLNLAQRSGYLDKIIKNNGQGGGSTSSW